YLLKKMSFLLALTLAASQDSYTVRKDHPRLFIEDVKALARRCDGPLAQDYKIVKDRADASVAKKWASIPDDLLHCALAYLVERERGNADAKKYADQVIRDWETPAGAIGAPDARFGYAGLAYDWIYDALTPAERVKYADQLAPWLRWYTQKPEILLKYGYWEYNQTWGPAPGNTDNSRDSIHQKLFIALAILGAGSQGEADAKTFLDSFHRRVPTECLPAFERMGGVWSESFGHGSYGPVTVIPYAFQAWKTATGIDLLKSMKPWSYPLEEPRWVAYTMLPHSPRTAFLGDNNGVTPGAFAKAAPMLHDPLSRWFADRGREWYSERWQRVTCLDPSIVPTGPETLPLSYLFGGMGHLYARSAWNDPNATWLWFGCGPQFAAHARDDVGHFLVYRKGSVVSRQGGQGHNDSDMYSGGSIIFNIPTIYDPSEKFRRDQANENDGGLLRHVYEQGPFPKERGRIVAYEATQDYTYAAADMTQGYSPQKAKEVTRQILYLRGKPEFIVIFDRVEATRPEFRRHFFLHVPTEPESGSKGLSWLSLPEADGDRSIPLSGRTRAFLRTVLPAQAEVTTRGGPGKEAWGHPLEPTAQYNHAQPGRDRPPVCPWRIEVGDPGTGARSLFLHVLELVDDTVREATAVAPAGPAGVDIGGRWKIRFQAEGSPGGSVGGRALPTTLKVEGQYRP
ncbi:MAG TPA: hypothetical protein VEN81_16345, partial [Planctomycetota bacterium]|nr:hypothetical protein [Planctomycetota bacterium]